MNLGAETILQINLVSWLSHNYPDIAEDVFSTSNERKCSVQQGRIFKRMGVKRGVSDLMIAVPMNGYHGLFLELKEANGKLSKEQKEFIERMTARGYKATWALGLENAKKVIVEYLQETNAS